MRRFIHDYLYEFVRALRDRGGFNGFESVNRGKAKATFLRRATDFSATPIFAVRNFQTVKDWETGIERLLDVIPGLEIEPARVESESDLAISELRAYKPFEFGYLSFAHGELDLTGDF